MLNNFNKYKRHFIFDVSSGYVSGAVVYFNQKNKKPTIEFSVKKNILAITQTSLTELRKKTVVALDEVCREMANFVNLAVGEFLIESGSVFLSSPWINFDNYVLIDEQIKPFKVTNKYLENVLKKDLKDKKTTLVKSQIVSVRANGYETNLQNLIGQKVSKLEIAMIDSKMNSYNREFIEKVILNNFNFLKIEFSSFLPVLFNQIKYIYDLEDDFIFLDLTGSVTDFGIFQNNRVKNISSLPIGKNFILEKMVSLGMATDMRIANSILTMYLRDELEKDLKQQTKKIIDKFGNKFREDVEKILEKFKTKYTPLNVFIVSSKETRFLLNDLDIFDSSKKLTFIDKILIQNFVEAESKYFDPFLALEAEYLFIHIFST